VTRDIANDPRITAVGLLFEAQAALSARFAAQLAEHELSQIEFEVLLRLARSPGQSLRMTDLSAQTTLSTSGVTRVVDRMERDGLVCRRACSSDRRISYTVITEAGLARLQAVLPGHLELIERWFTSQLSCADLQAMLASLRAIRDALIPQSTPVAAP
jgi:DNA-binding MarR family transcriptional regulator